MLAVMMVQVVFVGVERMFRYALVRKMAGGFVREVNPPLMRNDLFEAGRIASRFPGSHVARVVSFALETFQTCPDDFTHVEAIEVVERSMKRSRSVVHAELRQGLGTLAMIASTAPFLGLLGTVVGILDSFLGFIAPEETILAWISQHVSEALASTGVGLVVAVSSAWLYKYLSERVEIFDLEMLNASSELTTYLTANLESFRLEREGQSRGVAFLEHEETRRWEVAYDHQRILMVSYGIFTAYVTFLLVSRSLQQ